MNKRKKRTIWALSILTVLLVVVCGIALQRKIREQYWIGQLNSSDLKVQDAALNRLGHYQCVRAIPKMVEILSNKIGDFHKIAECDKGALSLHHSSMIGVGDIRPRMGWVTQPERAIDLSSLKRFIELKNEAGIDTLEKLLDDSSLSKVIIAVVVLIESEEEAKKYIPNEYFVRKNTVWLKSPPITFLRKFVDIPND